MTGTGANHYKLIGISSHENDYRLSWAVNRALELNFRKADNIMVNHSNSESINHEFSLFQFVKEEEIIKMNLISNRCPDGFLIREMKNIDFFLQVFGNDAQAFIDNILVRLKSIDIVSAVFEIPRESFKSTWYLPSE